MICFYVHTVKNHRGFGFVDIGWKLGAVDKKQGGNEATKDAIKADKKRRDQSYMSSLPFSSSIV